MTQLLKDLYEVASHSGRESKMIQFIKNELGYLGVSFYEDKMGNVYVTRGKAETYPCLVAHMDEVHTRRKGYTVQEANGMIFGVNTLTHDFNGIGADDKNGIWVCLMALSYYSVLKVAFFVQEEVGCVGSNEADMNFFKDCRFVLQCDRKGSSDFIVNGAGVNLCTDEFVKSIDLKKFGYVPTHGGLTDVVMLTEKGLGLCTANISCGYYNPHMDNEMTDVAELYNCYELVKHIIDTCTDVYKSTYDNIRYNNCCTLYDDTYSLSQMDEVRELLNDEVSYDPNFSEDDLIQLFQDYDGYYTLDYETWFELWNEAMNSNDLSGFGVH